MKLVFYMKHKNFIIIIALCISLTPQTNFTAQQPADSWWNWATQKAQTAMSGLSKRMKNIYNKVGGWSTITIASVFLATAGALIARGYDKETLEKALYAGISVTGDVLHQGLKIIQEHPGKIAAVGLGTYGGIKLLQTSKKQEPSITEYDTSITDQTSIAEYVNSLLHDQNLQHEDLDGITNYNKHIDNISRKLAELLNANNLQYDDQYIKDLAAVQKISPPYPLAYEIAKDIKKRLGDKFQAVIESKRKKMNMEERGYFWLAITDIFNALYGRPE